MISNEKLKELKNFLKDIKDLSEKEDWDEFYAQSLVFDGAFLYDKIFDDDSDGNKSRWRSLLDLPITDDLEDEWDERCVIAWLDAENPPDEGVEITTLGAIRDGDYEDPRYLNPVWRTVMDAPIFNQ